MKRAGKWLIPAGMAAVFAACYWLPVERLGVGGPIAQALYMLREYARSHVLLCLVPAFFIAGGVASFIKQTAVMRYLGAGANKLLAYGVASVSGGIMAVCSCTVLPIFAGIYRMGAGLGPATTFLYSGPAINVLAILLTFQVLGWRLGLARAVGAIAFSIVIGLAMHLLYRREELAKAKAAPPLPRTDGEKPLWKTAMFFAAMVGILVFANWPGAGGRVSAVIHSYRWLITASLTLALAAMLIAWFSRKELTRWTGETWGFARQILPLLFLGVAAAGLLLGRAGREGLIPSHWVQWAVGGNSLRANFFASLAGALMYFATLTEVPILQGLIGSGMGRGPALALLLAGPAISLPNMLVIRSVLGTRKTLVYVALVVVMSTAAGMIFGIMTE